MYPTDDQRVRSTHRTLDDAGRAGTDEEQMGAGGSGDSDWSRVGVDAMEGICSIVEVGRCMMPRKCSSASGRLTPTYTGNGVVRFRQEVHVRELQHATSACASAADCPALPCYT